MSQVSVTPNISPPQSTYGAPPQTANASSAQSYAPPTDSYSYGQSASGQSPLIQSDSSESASPSANSSAKQNAGFSAANTAMIAAGTGVGAAAAVALPWAIIAGRKRAGAPDAAAGTNGSKTTKNSTAFAAGITQEQHDAALADAKDSGRKEILAQIKAEAYQETIKNPPAQGSIEADHEAKVAARREDGCEDVRANTYKHLQPVNPDGQKRQLNDVRDREIRAIKENPSKYGFAPNDPERKQALLNGAAEKAKADMIASPPDGYFHAPGSAGHAGFKKAVEDKHILEIIAKPKDYNFEISDVAIARNNGRAEATAKLEKDIAAQNSTHKTALDEAFTAGQKSAIEQLKNAGTHTTISPEHDAAIKKTPADALELVKGNPGDHTLVANDGFKAELEEAYTSAKSHWLKNPPNELMKADSKEHTDAVERAKKTALGKVESDPAAYGLAKIPIAVK